MGDMADMALDQAIDEWAGECDSDYAMDDADPYERGAPRMIKSKMTLVHATGKAVLADTVKWGRRWLPRSRCLFDEDMTTVQVPAWLVGRWQGTGV